MGSAPQLFATALMSFSFGCLHVAAWPYRRAEDNWLRLAVELEIFMVITVAMVLAQVETSNVRHSPPLPPPPPPPRAPDAISCAETPGTAKNSPANFRSPTC